jgi:predicted nucleic acid-binding protein
VSLVLDSSVALAWVFSDEGTYATEEVLKSVGRTGACAPAIWPAEVANGLLQGMRRGRLTPALCEASLADLEELEVAIDPETNEFAWKATLQLANRYRLTLYDACYLELAARKRLPLATLDRDLRRAAELMSVDLLGLSD